MKFLILLAEKDHFDNWDAVDDAGRQTAIDAYNAFGDAVRARGTLLVGDALDRPEAARTLGPGPDRVVTRGPFAETVEQVGGFYLVELPDLATAVEVAALLPAELSVEVRPTLGIQV